MIDVTVTIRTRESVLDPESETVVRSLHALGYGEVRSVRMARRIELELDDMDHVDAHARVLSMCDQLLANAVIDEYEIEVPEPAARITELVTGA